MNTVISGAYRDVLHGQSIAYSDESLRAAAVYHGESGGRYRSRYLAKYGTTTIIPVEVVNVVDHLHDTLLIHTRAQRQQQPGTERQPDYGLLRYGETFAACS